MNMVLRRLDENEQVEAWERASSVDAQARAALLAGAYVPDALMPTLPDWSVAGRDHLLLLAYQHQFGEDISVEGRCHACGAKTQLNFSTSQLLNTASSRLAAAWHSDTATLNTEVYLTEYHEMEVQGLPCQFRLPRIQDFHDMHRGDASLRQFAQRVIAPSDFAAIEETFSAKKEEGAAWEQLYLTLEQAMLSLEPLSVVTLNATCPECSAQTEHQFDIANQFWAQLSAAVEKQLWDVHILASAYGWSSQDILSMSSARRRRHIAMLIE
ncbi:hypothetical protein [Enterovibrio coralii]|uniref:Phage baseplate protein n=1 Tax=Enterovibrio coralii TaxID=294935 RepID=A0A135IC37_9GAMM|nr:hypothetical protein [Enterovibrio coralii]KXF83020.1 hypothetical protein ATN88_04595 [Enterovibrio coralii]